MPRRPSPLRRDAPPVFTVAEALHRGIHPGRLTRSDLRAPYPGLRTRADAPVPTALVDRCREYAPRLKPWQFYSHATALALHGAPLPEWPRVADIHVSAHRPAREPRISDVVGHRLQTRESSVVMVSGMPVEDPVRAWRQAATRWGLDDLIVAADFLVSGARPLASVDELRREIDEMGDVRGGILRRALREVRVGPRSPRETKLRLLLVRAGLPEPEISWNLTDSRGLFVAELDLAYPRWLVAPEYDGRVHAENAEQFAKDADRWERIRHAGWDHVRVLNHHMAGGGVRAVAKVHRALVAAGWRPGDPA